MATRARDVAMILRTHGTERGLVKLVTELLERMAALEQDIRDVAVIQLNATRQLEQIVDGAGAIRKQVEQMQRGSRDDDDDLPSLAS